MAASKEFQNGLTIGSILGGITTDKAPEYFGIKTTTNITSALTNMLADAIHTNTKIELKSV